MPAAKPLTAFAEKSTEKLTEIFSLLFVVCRRAPMTTLVTDNPRRNTTMYSNQLNGVTPGEKIFLSDGTELRLCANAVPKNGNRKLYCSAAGKFYSLSRRGLNPVKYVYTKNFHWKPNNHSNYPRMCNYRGNPSCHLLIAFAWIGPRRDKQECHHLNGDLTDNRASNLIWLSHEEHLRYDAALRAALRRGKNLAGDVYEGE